MSNIKIHIFHTGKVCVSPNIPFGGDNCNPIKASGIFEKKTTNSLSISYFLFGFVLKIKIT